MVYTVLLYEMLYSLDYYCIPIAAVMSPNNGFSDPILQFQNIYTMHGLTCDYGTQLRV